MIYLDYAATSYKKPEAVYRAVESVLRRGASVGRGGYPASRFSAERVFACREEVRRLFSAPSEDAVVFTCNATMALNMAIKGLLPSGGSDFHGAVTRSIRLGVGTGKLNVPDSILADLEACRDQRASAR